MSDFTTEQLNLIRYLKENYSIVHTPDEADLKISTSQLYTKIKHAFPGQFSITDIAPVMRECGFKYFDVNLTFLWLMKHK